MTDKLNLKAAKVLLLDIEGTICSILFVKDVLYPYFILCYKDILNQLQYPLKKKDTEDNELDIINNIVIQFPKTESCEHIVQHIEQLVDQDIKDPTLKALQGFVWKLGYEKGHLVAPVYPDAIELIKSFSKDKKVYIYSSGSVKAQKLLFQYVKDPSSDKTINLNGYLSGYFDITTSGYKQQQSSYVNILADIGYSASPEAVLFLSDNVNEIRAAKEAHLQAIIVQRPGNNPLEQQDIDQFGVVTDFSSFS